MPLDPRLEHVYTGNLKRLLAAAEQEGYDTLVLLSPSNVLYATGVRSPSGPAIVSKNCGNSLVVPLLDYDRVSASAPRGFDVYATYRGGEESIEADVPKTRLLKGGLSDALKSILSSCSQGRVGADLSGAGYALARSVVEKLGVEDATSLIRRVRAVKSDEEVALIEEAARIAHEAFARLYQELGEGDSEAGSAGRLVWEMLRRGAWQEAFPSIVAFYANTAYPHHTPTTLILGNPGPVLVDWGAVHAGYRSDTTRTWWYGGAASPKFREIVEAVAEAQAEAIDMVSAGVEAWEVDAAARRVLEKRGLKRYFIHGLGHGVGVDIHEEPYLRPGSKTVLEPGMVVTIEPGVYMSGLFGVRIEDMVLVTKGGRRIIGRLPRLLP